MNTAWELIVKIGTGALGGAVVVLFLAPWVAHRQEVGKARATALLELRARVGADLSYVRYNYRRMRAAGSYVGDPFSVTHRAALATKLVASAWGLSPRMQAKVRSRLVAVFGEVVLIVAERFSLAEFKSGSAASDAGTWSAAMLEAGQDALRSGAPTEGSYALFAANPLKSDGYERVETDLMKLLDCLGGDAQLGRRRWWGIRARLVSWRARRRPATGGGSGASE
ncbi:hypothetical protein [Streptomyces sp. NPDC041003]|uniref:hypothetical protein n=1 Tax=Streptomyces sp. NPDC041003 TaxID=3155730 RepID=UPI0033D1E9B1